jgi:hypothetical protein
LASSPNVGTIIKILGVLGVKPLANLALYRLGLASGHYRRASARLSIIPDVSHIQPKWPLRKPDPEKLNNLLSETRSAILENAQGILKDQFPLFGGQPADIVLAPTPPLTWWTDYTPGRSGEELGDIKFTWESARFCWAVNLAQAYLLSGDAVYEEKFWDLLLRFTKKNPPFQGPNWVSAQECAVRILTTSFALSVFYRSNDVSDTRKKMALEFLVMNARRIPLTLAYSRAQNNNHLLLEGAGLFTAGSILQGFEESPHWKSLGWKIIQSALKDQIGADGDYCQHSMNYHRFMLQASLWINSVLTESGQQLPSEILEKLRSATTWYSRQIDCESGKAPNFGSNDGTWLFPLGSVDFSDHRPTAQAACLAFFGKPFLPKGAYDEIAEWMGVLGSSEDLKLPATVEIDSYHRIGIDNDWAIIRTTQYQNRPFQADQLHLDLWNGGENILLDAGTYSYNAPPPWENSLAGTIVHNTAMIDGKDQMTRANRFLWLDWAQAKMINRQSGLCEAYYNGYRGIGVQHTRRVQQLSAGLWVVWDTFSGQPSKTDHEVIIQWLLPDGNFDFKDNILDLTLGKNSIKIYSMEFQGVKTFPGKVQLIRAGELICGEGEAPEICGWYSPTYGQKIPALSYRAIFTSALPLTVLTRITIDPSSTENRSESRCISC